MNKLIYFIFIIFITFLSCDGRDRVHKSNEEILVENNLFNSFSEDIKYFPETYNEIETDTILNNGFTIKIKHFTDANSSVIQKLSDSKITTKNYYRNTIADIIIHKEGKLILNKRITKNSFLDIEKLATNQLNDLVMNVIHVNDEEFTEPESVKINFYLEKPNSDYFIQYNMIVTTTGDYKLEKTKKS